MKQLVDSNDRRERAWGTLNISNSQVEYYLTTEFGKLKFEFVTIEDDSDYGTADSLREYVFNYGVLPLELIL